MATNLGQNRPPYLYLLHWHSEMDCNIAMWMEVLIAQTITLHHVEFGFSSPKDYEVRNLNYDVDRQQEALLLQRDRATCLSVEILQLQNVPFEN